jgi:protein FAM50
MEVIYSYYDGTGHKSSKQVKKSTSVGKFLDLVKQEFKELRGLSSDGLMFVKEDLIIPHVR